VVYVRHFGGRAPARKAAATDFERHFRQLEEEMQDLMRQFEEVSAPSQGAAETQAPRADRRRRPPDGTRLAVPRRTGHDG
jgi:hypothetical protein